MFAAEDPEAAQEHRKRAWVDRLLALVDLSAEAGTLDVGREEARRIGRDSFI